MGVAIPILLLLTIGVAVGCILDYFGNRRTFQWYVQTACFLAYFFPFSIIVMLPLVYQFNLGSSICIARLM